MPPKRLQITSGGHEEEKDLDDPATLLSLIAKLSLEDVNELRSQHVGARSDGTLTDEELALELFAEEATVLDTFARDMRVAQSLGRALESDADLLDDMARLEEMARRDREFAIAIAEGRRPTYHAVQQQGRVLRSQNPQKDTFRHSSCRDFIAFHGPIHWLLFDLRSNSRGAVSRHRGESCVICRDPIEDPIVRAPCGDTYDVGCLVDLYRAATVDESLFPPACCRQPFNFDEVRVHLDEKLIKLVEKKTIEFGTKNRVYCYRPTCSTFLGAATTFARKLLCTTCWAYTCGHCKGAGHDSLAPCASAEDEAVVALAEQAGWRRCPGCGHLVELSFGCYHMTCRCRHQFCYLCTSPWKSCSCVQWDENRLLVVAEDRVHRQGVRPPARGGNAVEYQQRVAREAERLREDHNCVHRWRYVVTAGNCEGCGHFLRLFLFQCRGCHMWVCARCRRNRWL
ncbi:hypothetical protein BD414DRAFT_410253 [Trametes punicea]|nr:hypothetical protein BD414DRAFT_410253 [Trametes punicea]